MGREQGSERSPEEKASAGAGFQGPSVWFALLVVVIAAAALAWTEVPTEAVVIVALLLVAVSWATRVTSVEGGGSGGAERRRLKSLQRSPWPDAGMKTVMDALDEPCILVDATEVVRYVNREATARYGSVRPGDPLAFRLRVPDLHQALDRVLALVRPETVEWQEKIPTERWLRAHLAPVRQPSRPSPGALPDDQRPDFVLIRLEDLTESRRVERMRADFVANASHELRTPLAAVSGFIETLQGPARNDTPARERFLGIMAEQAGRMKRLIDDLLSLSRIEMKAHLKPEGDVDLAAVVRQVCDLARTEAANAGVEIGLTGCDAPFVVPGDRDELVQVATNFVENALKYGASGKRIDISLSRAGRWATFSVKDHGRGIDPVHLPRLTERFYRAHTEASGEKRGTGLGLAIVKHIVTRHGGRLDIDSRLGEGATFSVRLPARVDET